jgi:alkanesulfonate monooxygenase SsuD/methylene tetrahydromethanopterin reductase-like flavin-dependent oxidoreductase (luciferase family)
VPLPISFATPAGNARFEQTLATALAAEAAGFDAITLSDRPHDPILDGWTLGAAVLGRTERIRLFHTTLNIPYRFPAVMAKEAATLDQISGGRLDLCLGAGGEGNRPLYDTIGVPLAAPGERLDGLEEAIAILRGLWTHDKFSYEGRIYSVDGAPGQPKPVQPLIPIWIGAAMPRSLRMAGRIADGYIKNGGWGSVEDLAALNRAVDAAALKAGRDPGSLRHILNSGGYLARDKADAESARAGQRGGFIGTTDEVLGQIRAYLAAGVNSFIVRFPADVALAQIERFGAEVIPEARKLAS